MIRLMTYIAIAASFILGIGSGAASAAAKPVIPEGCREVVYSTNPQYPPYDWGIPGGFDGASIELLRMAMPPGLPLRPAVYPWKRVLYLAKQGEIDLVVSLRITPERSRYLVFAPHRAFPNPIVVFARKDRKFPYASRHDLKGLRGGISAGDTFGGGFDEYWRASLTVEEAPTMRENFQKLDSGRIDYFVTSRYAGEAYLAKFPPAHVIVPLSPAISSFDIHFGFSKRSACAPLAEYVSRRLAELDGAGTPERLLQKYLQRYRGSAPDVPGHPAMPGGK
ncbi:ABC transporter substrate-binding protein [Geobacter sp. AOG2]|uniref:substrate-binding periplasmic protein n=1 Tax=Geobacter sp. AOG2 TaxID=1566347 RepID=UPI001CC72EC7|nr:transporter substrate-binding domain-containing protein [Geobacter sp. AOG2]GFE62900.1 hypothetical protein AOG2_34890 [Geobacter sp. AOG2]